MDNIMQMWNDPHARHAMVLHWPIVLAMLAPIGVLAVAMTKGKNRAVTLLALLVCLGGAAGAFAAARSGHDAAESVEMRYQDITKAEADAVEEHEHMGKRAWLGALPGTLCVGLCLIGTRTFKPKAALLVVAFGASAWFAYRIAETADAGGRIVYQYGIGVGERGKAEAVQGARVKEDHEERY